jgi:hypothetical protein
MRVEVGMRVMEGEGGPCPGADVGAVSMMGRNG